MPFEGGFTFANFLADVLAVFFFVVWFWLLIIVFGDLFRRHDISGWGKALWVIGLVLFPYLGVFAYMIFQSEGMAERATQQALQARNELRRTAGFSVADEITKLDQLRASGSITSAEYARLRGRLV
jgi:predicted membrane channel-forming protein YqfA (hemolysin III family)